jgi:hypothetical protein
MCATPITVNVPVEQLCVGLYVHLDISWLDHSFALNSFKIKNEQEILALRQLGLKTIRVNPSKSDCRPLPPPSANAPVAEVALPTPEELEKIKEKRARIDRLLKERNAIAECEKELLKAAGTLKILRRTCLPVRRNPSGKPKNWCSRCWNLCSLIRISRSI